MSQKDVDDFRLYCRVSLLERLVLKTAFVAPLLDHRLSAEESRDSLKGWLDLNSQAADLAYGKHFRDPAQTALYADEVKEITEKLKLEVDKLAARWNRSRES